MAKNKKNGKKNKKLEDTLDYYNEKTTRDVVGKLLEGIDEEDDEEESSAAVSEDDDKNDDEEKNIDYDDANIYSRRRSRGRKSYEKESENTSEDISEEESEEEKEFDDDEFIDDYPEKEGTENGNMAMRFMMLAMLAIFLIVLTVFAVSLNNTKKELAQAQKQLAAAKISTGENNALDTDVKPAISQSDEKLKKENENLKIENEKLKKQIGEMQTAENKENNNDEKAKQDNAVDNNANTSTSSDPIIPDTYVVAENDNFAKISEKLYGTQNYYLQIAEYNGMSPDEPLSIGTVIRIPIPEY